MKQQAAAFALLSIMLFAGEGNAFCPTSQQRTFSSVAMNLLPNQGKQLVAAYNAANSKEDDEGSEVRTSIAQQALTVPTPATSSEPSSSSSHWRALAASRSFVSRVFHLPSSHIKKHPHPTIEGLKEPPQSSTAFPFNFLPQHSGEKDKEDAVLYPIVGFRFVKSSSPTGGCMALPTTSHAACRLPTNRNEQLFGWYSPGCKLDLYSDDVCHEPNIDGAEETSESQPSTNVHP